MMQKTVTIYITIILILFFCGYYYLRLDDSYIYYKYAKNIADGNGYVFNAGEKINATTSPLYTIVLALIYGVLSFLIKPDFTIIGNLISILSILWMFYSMKKILSNDKQFNLFALIFLTMPTLKFGFGMEAILNLAIITFSLFQYQNGNYTLASMFTGLSVLARFDSILFAFIILLHFIITNKKFPSLKYILSFLTFIIPWFVFSKIYFNSLLPLTINAKLIQNKVGLFGDGFIFLKDLHIAIPGGYYSIIFLILFIVISILTVIKHKINLFDNSAFAIIIIWSGVLFINYAFILNVSSYQWYLTPFSLVIALLLSFPLSINKSMLKFKPALMFLLFVMSLILPIKNYFDGYNPKYMNYKNASEWLNKNTVDNSVIATDEIGILGYYCTKGRIVDALGLINPEVHQHLIAKDFNWFINYYSPDYIVNDYPVPKTYLIGNSDLFKRCYKVEKIFNSKNQQIAVYKRINNS